MGMCYSEDCNNHYDNMMNLADIEEENRQNKITSEYDNLTADDFEEAMRNAEPQDYINMFDAFKANDQKAMLEAVKKLQLDYVSTYI